MIRTLAAFGFLASFAVPVAAQTPLTDFNNEERYRGETGGLYGNNSNVPPPSLAARIAARAAAVQKLDASGNPAPDGRIVFVSIGMSNTAIDFKAFRNVAGPTGSVVLVNGAQGGKDSAAWAETDLPWEHTRKLLADRGLTPEQVEIVWLYHARVRPGDLGEYPAHSDTLAADLRSIIRRAGAEFPNLQLVFLSSRNYAGYAKNLLNPEPFAYESAFAVRSVVTDPENGLDDDAPVALWGPYTWANGAQPRADGLTWERDDFTDQDGVHPTPQGAAKSGRLLLDFFQNSPATQPWWPVATTQP